MTNHFIIALQRTMMIEGEDVLTADKMDPGGMTFSGISRVYWHDWPGWPVIDQWLADGGKSPAPNLTDLVRSFYLKNFWNRVQGDKVAELAPEVAYELFDTAVNLDTTRAITFLQTAHNIARGEYGDDIEVDGQLGTKTLKALRIYLQSMPGTPQINEEILLNCMNGEQYIFYRANPRRKYFRGWFRRV